MGKYNKKDNHDYLLQNNLLGIRFYEELEQAETLAFSLRAIALEQGEYEINAFTKEDFQDLHRYLFQDIYSFAGEFREVQLIKGNTHFCQFQFLDSVATKLFQELDEEPTWHSLEEAASRLAYFKSELNMLHPFREGNGRTIRIFIHAYATARGFEWAYETIDRERYMRAMIQSVIDLSELSQLFFDTLQ